MRGCRSRDYSMKRWDYNDTNGEWVCGSSVSGAHESYVSAICGFSDGRVVLSGSVKGVVKVRVGVRCICCAYVAPGDGVW